MMRRYEIMKLKKFIARKTFPLRKRLGCAPSEHKDMRGGGLSLEKVFAKSYAHTVNIELFIAGRDQAVGAITSHANFIVSGWLDSNYLTKEDISLLGGGEPLDCPAVKCMNAGKSDVAVHANSIEKFQFVIPGYVWRNLKRADELEFKIQASSQVLNSAPLKLTRQMFLAWLANIQKYRNQYFSLLALEHLHHHPHYDELGSEVRSYYAALASEHNLQSPAITESLKKALEIDVKSKVFDAKGINEALKSLNHSLNDDANDILEQIKFHIEKYNLTGDDRIEFLILLVPFLCRENKLLDLLSAFMKPEEAKNYLFNKWSNTNLSILLAMYAAEQLPHEVSKALYTLSDNNSNGEWIHTECIGFACSHVLRLEHEGLLKDEGQGEVCYAFLSLLDSFGLPAFSRLYDHKLVETMVDYLHNMHHAPTWLQRDLINAAIKHYGLNPYFWELLESSHDSLAWLDCDILEAYHCWRVTQKEFNAEGVKLSELSAPLKFYANRKNQEAYHFIRAACMHDLNKGTPINDEVERLVNQLAQQNPLERLRILGHPAATDTARSHQDASGLTWESIRREAGNSDLCYHGQRQAAGCLRNFQLACAANDYALMDRECSRLIHLSQGISKRRHAYLGIHLCVFALARLLPRTCDANPMIDFVIGELISIAEHIQNNDDMIPAPLQSSLELINQSSLRENRFLQTLSAKLAGAGKTIAAHTAHQEIGALAAPNPSSVHSDTIVVIYSCRKYLDTRVQAIRDTWLKDLKAHDIPYLIAVGDGDDQLHGDLLTLKVADNYEHLPQKSLKLYEWIYQNTDAHYVLKIDDDCFLNVQEYFDSLSYRKHHYYGRALERTHLSIDRAWHQSKSTSEHARSSLDKSPTPSVYADGGSSYCLSRGAMVEILSNAKTHQGQNLVQSSYMEDKLVGDLLAMSGIYVSSEDFSIHIRRRTFAEASPVAVWANGFLPSRNLPVKVVHLDTDRDMSSTYEHLKDDTLLPKKIWPATQDLSLLVGSNQLELLTHVDQCTRLLEEKLFVISVIRNEMTMLPHFLEHYRSMGVKSFIMIDNLSDDGSREYILNQPDVVLYSADTDYNKSHYGVAWQQAVLSSHCLNKWVLMADADEFLVYPDLETKDLAMYVSSIEDIGYDCVKTEMVDMYPPGDLEEADFAQSRPFDCASYFDRSHSHPCHFSAGIFSNHTSTVSNLRHRLDKTALPNAYTNQKYALVKYKPWMHFSEGLHDSEGVRVADKPAYFAHFKYHAGFKEKSRIEIERGQHYAGAAEYKRYLALLAETEGRFYNEATSVKYQDSSSFSSMVIGKQK